MSNIGNTGNTNAPKNTNKVQNQAAKSSEAESSQASGKSIQAKAPSQNTANQTQLSSTAYAQAAKNAALSQFLGSLSIRNLNPALVKALHKAKGNPSALAEDPEFLADLESSPEGYQLAETLLEKSFFPPVAGETPEDAILREIQLS